MDDKFFRLIGLAQRARKIEVGEAKAEDRIRNNKSRLIIISSDASENTLKKMKNLCINFNVEFIIAGKREILGNYTGREFAVVLSVSDRGFAKSLKQLAEKTANI